MVDSYTREEVERDFARDVWCLLGLPVDNLTTVDAMAQMRQRVILDGNTILSTINVNWVVQSLTDSSFRKAIIDSDLVALDGRPLLWLAKMLGYPMGEVVAGSTLIQKLLEEKANPLTLFLFGGEEGVAEKAMDVINSSSRGLKAVGALNPGFGTVEKMSSDQIINIINEAKPDILLVALGARKGTQWIEHNRHRLHAKIISHLGATINFVAGTVKRAPESVGNLGLEWAWRIIQEPKLFSRYFSDGLVFIRLLLRCFKLSRLLRSMRKQFSHYPVDVIHSVQLGAKNIKIQFGQTVLLHRDTKLRKIFIQCALSGKDVILDFHRTKFVDGDFAGLLLILMKHLNGQGKSILLVNVEGNVLKVIKLFCIEQYFSDNALHAK